MVESCVVIGLGQIGMGYDIDLTEARSVYTHTRAISVHSAFLLVGGVDISPAQRARFERRYGLPSYDQIEVALRQLQPDVVVIATPSASHAAILAKVIKVCQPKLVLCEKPLACELDVARGMVEMCEKFGIELFVNYIRRTDPSAIEIKRRLDRGEISTPLKLNAWYSKGIWNNGSHFLNLLELWLGDVNAATLINPGRLWNNRDPEPDFEVQFARGSAIFRAAWEESFSHYGIELLSPSGRLRYDKGGGAVEWQGVCEDSNFKGYRTLNAEREIISNGMSIYQWHVYEQICNHLNGLATTLCTGRQALKTLEAIDLIIKQRKP